MKVIPPVIYGRCSYAERKVHGILKTLDLEPGCFAFHSLNISEHPQKQWAEADFVIVGPSGIMVLEIKGGGVECNNGIWHYTDRYGRVFKSSEGPLNQAKSARFALENLIRKLLKRRTGGSAGIAGLPDRINFGWGLVFPDSPFSGFSVEIPPEIVFDRTAFKHNKMRKWLSNLFAYWKQKTGKKSVLCRDDLAVLRDVMRPEYDLIPPLGFRVENVYEHLVRLTEEQYTTLDILTANPRVIVEGGAGTGKTFLAREAARRLADAGSRPLFLCRSPVFAAFMKNTLSSSGIPVMNYEELVHHKNQNTLPDFDILVVDEGQDMLNPECLDKIERIMDGGFEKGHWLFFMDLNNQGALYGSIDETMVAYLRSSAFRVPLSINCRNTRQIAIQTLLYTGGDIGKCKIHGEGLPVDDSTVWKTREDELEAIERHLEKWMDTENIRPADISILSAARSLEESVVSGLSRRWKRRMFLLGEHSGTQWPPNVFTYSSIRDFKGLENKCIMLVDMEMIDSALLNELVYVGMTRANAVLWMAIPKHLKKILDTIKGENAVLLAEIYSSSDRKGTRHHA